MERELGEISIGIEELGISEAEEDKAVENPTVTVKQQQKISKNASLFTQKQKKVARDQKADKTVWKAQDQKKKKDIFVT